MTITAKTSDYLREKIINLTLRSTGFSAPSSVWMALYTNDPQHDNSGTELSGAGYARKQLTSAFTISAAGSAVNTDDITFDSATGTWNAVYYYGLLDASTSGNLLFYGSFIPRTDRNVIYSGETFRLNAEEMVIDLGTNLFTNITNGYSYAVSGSILRHVLSATTFSAPDVYLALYNSTPDRLDMGGVEVSAGDYNRIHIAGTSEWDAPEDISSINGINYTYTKNKNIQYFCNPSANDWGTLRGMALRTASSGGVLLYTNCILHPRRILLTDDIFYIPAGSFVVTIY